LSERIVSSADAMPPASSREVASGSRTLAAWTLISRATGFLRVAAIAAVFGPTFFGNLFQAALLVPYLVCELIGGSLITAMVPPHLVHALERGGTAAAARLARGFLGVVLPVYALAAVLVAAFAALILMILTSAVNDHHIRHEQIALGVPLLVLLAPQVIFYAITAVAISVQHAHRKFALSTAAPIIENVGTILVLGISASIFGIGLDVDQVTIPQLILLGVGSTLAVATHCAVQWYGASRLGVRLIPLAGWRDAEVFQTLWAAIPTCAAAALNSIGLLAFLTASGDIAGGVIAFQIGMNFYNLPIALSAFPIAFAQSPLLSRQFARADLDNFSATYRSSQRLTLFFALPACAAFLTVPSTLAGAISFGQMADSMAMGHVAAVLTGLAFGLVGESLFVVARSSAYARLDAGITLRAMALRTIVVFAGIGLSLQAGTSMLKLISLGLTYSAAVSVAALYINWHGQKSLVGRDSDSLPRWLTANLAIAAISVLPGLFLTRTLPIDAGSGSERIVGAALVLSMSGVLYLLLQFLRGSRELQILLGIAQGRLQSSSSD
jgi:putative peptidoglycan lipid II flippase